MTQVAVTCPACARSRVVNGRGRCRCGAYLVHHVGKGFFVAEGTQADPERTYLWMGEKWERFSDFRKRMVADAIDAVDGVPEKFRQVMEGKVW